MLFRKIINKGYRVFFSFFFRSRFKSFGNKSSMLFPLKIEGIENITIGSDVYVAYKTWLAAVPHTNSNVCKLSIGNGSRIGNFNHIYATESIIIENNVLTADKVYITDNLHNYENVNIPILKQEIKQIGNVVIGEGAWLGENVCVIGAKVGKNSVIGANSVVTRDIPDYVIAVGVPAKVIKKFNFELNKWETVR